MDIGEFTALNINEYRVSLRELLVWSCLNGSRQALEDIIEQVMVNQAAELMGLKIKDEELQKKSDEFRLAQRMYKAEETMEWLAETGISLQEYESFLQFQLLREKIKDSFSEDIIELYFRLSLIFDTAVISQIITESEEKAIELLKILKDGYKEFHTLARECSIDEEGRKSGGYLGRVKRLSLSPEAAVEIFGSKEGEIAGPIKTDQGYHIIKIEELQPPRLDEETRETVRELLYKKWLEEQFEKSHVEESIWNIIK